MATSTTNLGLTKPSVNDAADIGVLNSNFDKIDEKCNPALFAPSGYGLGTSGAQCDDCNNATVDGFYSLSGDNLKNGPTADTYFWFGSMFVVSRHGRMIEQMAFYENRIAVRANMDGVWTEWEYLNPRMILGIEYRTTERCEGKPVYVKRISLGTLPNNSEKTVSYGIIGYTPLSHEETFVSTNGWKICTHPSIQIIPNGDGYCAVKTTTDFSMYTGYTTLKYVYN